MFCFGSGIFLFFSAASGRPSPPLSCVLSFFCLFFHHSVLMQVWWKWELFKLWLKDSSRRRRVRPPGPRSFRGQSGSRWRSFRRPSAENKEKKMKKMETKLVNKRSFRPITTLPEQLLLLLLFLLRLHPNSALSGDKLAIISASCLCPRSCGAC